jgi:hypothetical protein
MRALCVLAGILALGPGAAACGSRQPPPVDFSDSTRAFRPEDYDRVRIGWTRHDLIVRDVGTVLEVWAIFKSPEFRQAYVEEYAAAYGLNPDERRDLLKAQLEAARTSYEFHVVAQSTQWKWNNLEHRDSVWKIALADGAGNEIVPTQISFERLPELYEMRFFPQKTDFSRTYTVRFPRESGGKFAGASTGQLKLRVSGPMGSAVATWQGGH